MKGRSRRGILRMAMVGFPLALVLPLGIAHAQFTTPDVSTPVSTGVAQQGWNLVPGAAGSLTLSANYRQTHVHLMPPVQWYENHSVTAADAAEGFQSATCTLGTDSSAGDAAWQGQQNDAMDISAFGLSTSNDGQNLTAQISVQNLSGGPGGTPALSGDGDTWYVTWQYGSYSGIDGYFLEASYPGGTGNVDASSNLPVDFQWGEIQAGTAGATSATYAPLGSASGSLDLTKNVITISAPLSDFSSTTSAGGPQAFGVGAALKGADAEGWASVGAPGVGGLIQPVDKLQTQSSDYVVGDAYPSCPAASTGGGSTGSGPASSAVPTQGSTNNLAYYGGPIVHKIVNHLIYWLPQAGTTTGPDGNACPEPAAATYQYEPPTYGSGSDYNYEQILQNYFKDLQGTSFYNLLGQYADRSSGAINNVESYGGAWTDPCGYTSTANPTVGAVPGGTAANPVYDTDIQNEVLRAIQINHWPEGLGNQYYVYLGFSVATCFNPNLSSPTNNACDISGVPPAFCAYHGDFMDPGNGNTVLYANMTDGALQTAFTCYSSPIGSGVSPSHNVPQTDGTTAAVTDDVADAEVSITSHEQFETVTDAMVGTANTYAPPLGWYDAANGEIGDKCGYIYGKFGPDGANITLRNGDRYIVQEEYDNWGNGCGLGDATGDVAPYAGGAASVPINTGWNLLSAPASGYNTSAKLVSDMTGTGQLPAGSVQAVATFHNGIWKVSVPGYTPALPLAPTDGVFALSKNTGGWAPSNAPYSSASTLTFGAGWNLVAAPWPAPGVNTDAMFNQIQAENNACQADAYTNGACNPTVSAIDAYGPTYDAGGNVNGAKFIPWSPAAPDSAGNATWPQPYGNQIPYTNGMWVNTDHSLSWTPQGFQCQTINNGMCQ